MSTYILKEYAEIYYIFYGPYFAVTKLNKASITFNLRLLVRMRKNDYVSVTATTGEYTHLAKFSDWDDLINNYPEIFL
jgi:hypothetical protein